ncbi:peptide deformylase [Candidatus Sumerlaeota bacterium]|nr:peptide deformylase [Candidatus Sumerlaeota bacterium]
MSREEFDILTYGNPTLREKCEPVEDFDDPELKQQIDRMAAMMYENDGIGLAASQVGIMKRFFICDVDWVEADGNGKRIGKRNLRVYINPQVVEESPEDVSFHEGCLSLPGIEGEVYRPHTITMRYQGLDGKIHTEAMTELLARVAQHETDHLDGVLFVDRMSFVKRAALAGKLNQLKRNNKIPAKAGV